MNIGTTDAPVREHQVAPSLPRDPRAIRKWPRPMRDDLQDSIFHGVGHTARRCKKSTQLLGSGLQMGWRLSILIFESRVGPPGVL